MIMNFNVHFNFRHIKYMFLMDNRLQLSNGTVDFYGQLGVFSSDFHIFQGKQNSQGTSPT